MSSAGLSPIDTGIGASCSQRRVVVRMAEPRRRTNAPKDTLYREILDEANDHPRLLDSQAGAGANSSESRAMPDASVAVTVQFISRLRSALGGLIALAVAIGGRWAVSTAQATSAVTEPQDGSGSLGQPFGRGPLAA